MNDRTWRACQDWATRSALARQEASARVDQRIADYVAECRVADLARQKRPVSSWINPTVIAAWRARQGAK